MYTISDLILKILTRAKMDRRVCRINRNELGWIVIPKGKVNVLSANELILRNRPGRGS